MRTSTLGILGMIGSPFLLAGIIVNGFNPNLNSIQMAACNLVYMSCWMCSVAGLWRLKATGESKWGKIVFAIQILFLLLANTSNVYELLQIGSNSTIYKIVEPFWPVSNLFMLVTGITVARAGILKGWKRYITAVVGMWLPVGATLMLIFSRTPATLIASGVYSTITWSLLGLCIYLTGKESREEETLTLVI
jgi:hypothetical protein